MEEKIRDENWLIRSAVFTYNYHNTFKPFFVNLLLYTTTVILPSVLFWDKIRLTTFAKAYKGYVAAMQVIIFAGICTDLSTKISQTLDWIDGTFEEIRKRNKIAYKYKMQKIHNYKLKMYELRNRAITNRWSKKRIIAKACIFVFIYSIIFIILMRISR